MTCALDTMIVYRARVAVIAGHLNRHVGTSLFGVGATVTGAGISIIAGRYGPGAYAGHADISRGATVTIVTKEVGR